jgi:hypothetical protein
VTESPGSPGQPDAQPDEQPDGEQESIRFLPCSTETLRDALRVLGVPEELLTVKWVSTPEDCYDPAVEGTPLDEHDQQTALAALLQRVATSIRAGHAIDYGNAANNVPADAREDAQVEETRMLVIDRGAAWSADNTLLVSTPGDPRHDAARRANRSGQVNQAAEEARWLWQSLADIADAAHADARAAHEAGQCLDKVPAALYSARTLARCVWSLSMIAYIEMADPDQIDSNEAGLLAEVLQGVRQSTAVLLRYGTNRGLLRQTTDAKGRPAYEVVADIVAAASGKNP